METKSEILEIDPSQRGWRSVFGQARRVEVEPVDATIAQELERVDPAEWR